MNLIKQSIDSVSWNILARVVVIVLGLVRSICLARWLPVEVFGIYAFAASIIHLTIVIPNFGMAGALIHKSAETKNRKTAESVHFTLVFLFSLIWAAVLGLLAFLILDKAVAPAVFVLIPVFFGIQMTQTPRTILIKQVEHKRLAMIQIVTICVSTIVSMAMAWSGFTLSALLAVDVITFLVACAGFYGYKPFFMPRFNLDRKSCAYFLGFGGKNFINNLLQQVLTRGDKLWTGIFLGKTQLGFYARAFRFANYPNMVLSASVTPVVTGTFAQLKHDREKLASVFFHTICIVIRAGFLLTGVFAAAAPELIVLVIGSKWLPMVDTFRILLVFTLFDPVRLIVNSLYIAVGRPGSLVRVRMVQVCVFGVLIFVSGRYFGIAGVAWAMVLMLFTGLIILLVQARRFVSFSMVKMFAPPCAAAAAGLVSVFLFTRFLTGVAPGVVMLVKMIGFAAVFALVISAIEYSYLSHAVKVIYQQFITDRRKQ